MRAMFRIPHALTLLACVAVGSAALAPSSAFAQAKQAPSKQMAPAAAQPPAAPPAVKQMALTDKQIEGVLASQKEVNAITDKIPENAKPDPKIAAQLDTIVKKYGFASYAEYMAVIDNITLVLDGVDPTTKKYIGAEAVLRQEIAQIEADKKMPAKDKKEALAALGESLKSPQPTIENKGNIDLVLKSYDKLADALMSDE